MRLSEEKRKFNVTPTKVLVYILLIVDIAVLLAGLLGLLFINNNFMGQSELSKYIVANIPFVSEFFDFMRTPTGLVCCLAVPIFVLLIIELMNLAKMYKNSNATEDNVSYLDYLDIERDIVHDDLTSKLKRDLVVEEDNSPLELQTKTENAVSYNKPVVTLDETVESEIYSTREFTIPKKIVPKTVPALETKNEFSANLHTQTPNQFKIEEIDVEVLMDTVKLSFGEEKGRDVFITVTKDYTNVKVNGEESEVNFALFKPENDEEQKVIIQKKSREHSACHSDCVEMHGGK